MSWYDDLGKKYPVPGIGEPGDSDPQYADFGARAFKWLDQDPGAQAERQRKALLYAQADKAGYFADQGQQGYGALGQEAQAQRDYLRRLASGQDSISAEQLRQGLAQGLAQQSAMVASAAPQNSVMAARTGAIQSGRMTSGMAGQQALAGLQERQNAQQALNNMILQQRQQDLQAALQSRQTAQQGYAAQNAGTPEKSNMEKYGPALQGGLAALIMSDQRSKTGVRDGTAVAEQALKGLAANLYRYKDERNGKGEQLGQMAQQLERTRGLAHTVVDTPVGKMVHGGKLAAALAAMLPGMDKRISRLEGKER